MSTTISLRTQLLRWREALSSEALRVLQVAVAGERMRCAYDKPASDDPWRRCPTLAGALGPVAGATAPELRLAAQGLPGPDGDHLLELLRLPVPTDAELDVMRARLRRFKVGFSRAVASSGGEVPVAWCEPSSENTEAAPVDEVDGEDLRAPAGPALAAVLAAWPSLESGEAAPTDGDDRPCTHGPDFRSVCWCGEPFEFTALQAAGVDILWRAWEKRSPSVSESYIFERIAPETGNARLRALFGKGTHPAWGTMIVHGLTKGTFRLSDPPEIDSPPR